MLANTNHVRTDFEHERDLELIARLYCQGVSQRVIGERLGVSQQQISYDLKIIQVRWEVSSVAKTEERIARELAKIDHIEVVAWEAWDRSCKDAETLHIRTETGGKLGGKTVEEETLKGQCGDPRFLDRIAWCVEQRLKIIGAYAPEKRDLNVSGKLTFEQKRSLVLHALRRIAGIDGGATGTALPGVQRNGTTHGLDPSAGAADAGN